MTTTPRESPDTYTPDELLCELRARERHASTGRASLASTPAAPLERSTQARSAFRDVPSRHIYEALLRMQRARYGSDDRRDLRVAAEAIPQAPYADAVAALFLASRVRDNGDGTSTLEVIELGRRFGLCPCEPFATQPSGAFGTSFLVSPTQVATAAHCFNKIPLTAARFVFGFRMLDDRDAQLRINNADIYRGLRFIERVHDERGPDWALIELDRAVTDRPPVRIRREGRIADSERVYVLGHPSGLPLKYADNASVRDNRAAAFFVANLDTYAGSSGSPVFNSDHVVEGIVARGEKDFVLVGDCYASLVYPDTGCMGQDCIRTTEFHALVSA